MYARHFGLQQDPFSLAPDPRFLYLSERHREALAHLTFGLQAGGGFVLLTGEIGAGKTTVCRAFLEQLPPGCPVAWIFNPPRDEDELLQAVCSEFGLGDPGPGRKARVDALNAFLLQRHARGQACVLVVDEAQALAPPVLESLRLLTNLETAERKLLQIVLVGQPELRALLARPDLEQLAQRVVARYHLGPLGPEEAQAYLRHRLAVAGRAGGLPFDGPALRRLHRASGGVPRRLNLLAGRALLAAYAQGQATAGAAEVSQAVHELSAQDRPPAGRFFGVDLGPAGRRGAAALLAALGVAGVILAWPAAAPWPWQAAAPSSAAPAAVAPSGDAPASAGGASGQGPPPGAGEPTRHGPPEWPAQTATREALLVALAAAWGVERPLDDPCVDGPALGLACHRSPQLPLATIRALDRPGVVTLQPARGAPVMAVLHGLSEHHALIGFDPTPEAPLQAWPLPVFGAAWLGDFSTWWRVAAALPLQREGRAAAVAAAQLDVSPASAPAGAERTAAVRAFQRAQGLQADGVPGTLTLMQWNRAQGIPEPRLRAIIEPASADDGAGR